MKEHFFFPPSAELVGEIDDIARRHHSRDQVFDDFLTMGICALAGGTMEEEYLRTVQPYGKGERGHRDIDRLANLFGKLVGIMTEIRQDILGDIFQGAISRGQNGQYFTPSPVTECMAKMAGNDGDRVLDPTCGSGRMLLSCADVNPNRYFVGQDIDLRCVKMTALNLALRNLMGHVMWGNALTDECKRVYFTGFNGVGFIRVEDQPHASSTPSTQRDDLSTEPKSELIETAPKLLRQGTLFDTE